MAQVGIVHIGTEYYREYAIEKNDRLIIICLRFGHTDWYDGVYKLKVNEKFQARFPDPDQIDFVNSVNLLIPLAGATTSGRSLRGRPIGDYLIARITDPDGAPLAGVKVRLCGPDTPAEGIDVTATATGDVIKTNPAPGDWFVISPNLTLMPGAAGAFTPTREVGTSGSAPPVLGNQVELTRNAVNELVARPLLCLRCPMCWVRFAVTAQTPSNNAYICPNDGFDWTTIVGDIQTAQPTFLSAPLPAQDPTLTPVGLHCRGVEAAPLATAFGPVQVYWDESRFADPDGGDYQLWGVDSTGAVLTAPVIGRHTWGAAAPHVGGSRKYEFHATGAGQSKAYNFPIPSNETTPLEGVLNWATIHHTYHEGRPQNSFATAINIQNAHFIDIGGTGPGADIAYHFVIDGNGSIYEGRPLGIKGSHVPGFNGGNVGIVMAGDFETEIPLLGDTPTPAQLASLNALVDVVAARFGLIKSVAPHQERDVQAQSPHSTLCPGQRLLPLLPPIRAKYPNLP